MRMIFLIRKTCMTSAHESRILEFQPGKIDDVAILRVTGKTGEASFKQSFKLKINGDKNKE